MSLKPSELAFHKAVFENDLPKVKKLLDTANFLAEDRFGNTPLHLAIMLGHYEIVKLIVNQSDIFCPNAQGWSAFHEAISRGDQKILDLLIERNKHELTPPKKVLKIDSSDLLATLDDFCMEIRWEFQSWIPFISRMLPSDTCRISKRGRCVRLDATLVDFADMKWQRGNLSLLFRAHKDTGNRLLLMDHNKKTFLPIERSKIMENMSCNTEELMTTDIIRSHFSTRGVSFHRLRSGWLFTSERTEKVSNYSADFYEVRGAQLVTIKRREHLTVEEVARNKKLFSLFSSDDEGLSVEELTKNERNIPPPPPCNLTWEEYHENNNNDDDRTTEEKSREPPCLGRKQLIKESRKDIKATVGISQDFPLSLETVMNVLQVVAPFKRFDKLRNFVEMKLPAGFPVLIEFPIIASLTAKVTFTNFELRNDLPEHLFELPSGYVLKDTSRMASSANLKKKKP